MTPLGPSDRGTLLRLARASVEDALRGGGALERAQAGALLTPPLRAIRAAFVTLRDLRSKDDAGVLALRGCLGTIDAHEPLFESVIHNAVCAALEDPRFPQVTASELPALRIEISALTPLREVASAAEIVAGRDGVELSLTGHRGVFLPQVAVEHNWNVEQLLDQLARKAGLPVRDWRGATLRTFQADVFTDDPCPTPGAAPARTW